MRTNVGGTMNTPQRLLSWLFDRDSLALCSLTGVVLLLAASPGPALASVVAASADLLVSKTDNPDPVNAGDLLHY